MPLLSWIYKQNRIYEITGKSSGTGRQVSEPIVLAAAQVEKETRPSTKQQWIQASGPQEEASVSGLMVSSWGDVYGASRIGIYRLAPDASAWTLVNSVPPEASVDSHGIRMAERNGTLYLVFPNGVFVSKDRGETWTKLGARPEGRAIGLVITNDGLYLALRDNEGIFRSTDGGKQWTPLANDADPLASKRLTSLKYGSNSQRKNRFPSHNYSQAVLELKNSS